MSEEKKNGDKLWNQKRENEKNKQPEPRATKKKKWIRFLSWGKKVSDSQLEPGGAQQIIRKYTFFPKKIKKFIRLKSWLGIYSAD
jgi:hypothetical protein